MRSSCQHPHVLSGALRVALVGLLAAPPLALSAQELLLPPGKLKGKEKEKERAKEAERPEAGQQDPRAASKAARSEAPRRESPGPRSGLDPVGLIHPANREIPQRGLPPVEVVRTPGGGELHRGPGGAVREVRTPGGAVIHVAPDGMRRVELARPDGRVLFAEGSGRGYIQRPFQIHGQAYEPRTYVEHGVVSVRVYRPCVYLGITYHVYQPGRYYRPTYYVWASRPWPRPVSYPWGWAGRPWFASYRGYFTPYPYYSGPIFWLTDFMVAATLESAYQARLDNAVAPPPYDPGFGLSVEVKQAIAEEVRRDVEQEQAEQQAVAQGYGPPAGGPPPLFSSNISRIFLVAGTVPAYRNGRECILSEGDVLRLTGAPAPGAAYADVQILASRTPGCPQGSTVSVSLQDLQEMQNQMRARVDAGLGSLQAQQGQAGLPPLPPQNLGAADAPCAQGVQAEPNAGAELTLVAQDANQAGQSTLTQTAPGSTPAAAQAGTPGTVSLGMTEQQVQGILGSPRRTADLGAKRIGVYQDFKITFVDGVVTDIQ